MDFILYKNYLYHHGIKGQRWGVRRYQNEDGSLTAKGKRRYEIDEQSGRMTDKGRQRYQKDIIKGVYKDANYADKHRNSPKNLSDDDLNRINSRNQREQQLNNYQNQKYDNARNIANNAVQITNTVKNTINSVSDNSVKYKPMDLSHMSNADLQNAITRGNLERQYMSVYGTPQVNKGRENVMKALEIGGGVLAVTGSALGIAKSIKELKHCDYSDYLVHSFFKNHGFEDIDW